MLFSISNYPQRCFKGTLKLSPRFGLLVHLRVWCYHHSYDQITLFIWHFYLRQNKIFHWKFAPATIFPHTYITSLKISMKTNLLALDYSPCNVSAYCARSARYFKTYLRFTFFVQVPPDRILTSWPYLSTFQIISSGWRSCLRFPRKVTCWVLRSLAGVGESRGRFQLQTDEIAQFTFSPPINCYE